MKDHGFEADGEDPLDVEMSGERGVPRGVVALLEATAEHVRQLPDDMRLDVKIELQEVDDAD